MEERNIIVDFDGDDDGIQNLRDAETGRYVEMSSVVDGRITGVKRGDNDQLVFTIENEWDDDVPE